MEKPIVVLDADENQCRALCTMLEERRYRAVPIHKILKLEKCIQRDGCLAVILNIDTVSVDNRTIRDLTIKNPGIHFLCLSKDRFHPELKDAICYHIYACINKPVDKDELFYWIKSIYENEVNLKNRSET
jgi:DNA-binding NtrC family response regulator